jgi:hypothetical protein
MKARFVTTHADSFANDPVQKNRGFDPADLFGVLKQYSLETLEDAET